MTSLLEDDGLDGPGKFWYDRAVVYYSLYHGNPDPYREQAQFWLSDYDYDLAMIAWDLVDMEHKNGE